MYKRGSKLYYLNASPMEKKKLKTTNTRDAKT